MSRILVVEDEAIVAMSLCDTLRRAGHVPLQPAATGEQAIRLASDHGPDVILMDINLASAMDGLQAALSIRGFSRVPIIFTSGYANEEVRERAMAMQPAGYLVKPLDLSALAAMLRAMVDPGDSP